MKIPDRPRSLPGTNTVSEPPPPVPESDNQPPWARGTTGMPSPVPNGQTSGWQATRQRAGIWSQIGITVAVFFGLLGLALGLFLLLERPNPARIVVIPVSQYNSLTGATNPTADRDAKLLIDMFADPEQTPANQLNTGLRSLLEGLKTRQDTTPLVIYVSAFAIVRPDGEVCLLPADAEFDQPDQWVRLSDVLDSVRNCPVSNKALLLDIAKPSADPFHGPLFDDVASRLDQSLKDFAPTFPVLCSCSPGEQSLIIPERGMSAFAAYVAEAMTGAADGYVPGSHPDGKVSLTELAQFVIHRVARWADKVPAASQVPKAYGLNGHDFILTYKFVPALTPETDRDAPPYPADFLNARNDRDSQRDGPGQVLAPDVMTQLEAVLLQAEASYHMGWGQADARLDPTLQLLQKTRQPLQKKFDERTRQPIRPLQVSFFDYRNRRTAPPSELVAALDQWRRLLPRPPSANLTATAPPTPPRAEERDAAQAGLINLLPGKTLPEKTLEGAWLVWDQLVNGPEISQDKVKEAVTVLKSGLFQIAPPPETAELLLLRQLDGPGLRQGAYPEAVRALLKAEECYGEAIAAAAALPPGGFSWVRGPLEEGDRCKRKGEEILFDTQQEMGEKSTARLKQAIENLQQAIKELGNARDRANSLHKAHRAWIQATSRLHASLPGMILWNHPTRRDWLDTAKFAGEMAERLRTPANGPIDFEFDAQARSLADRLPPPTTEAIRRMDHDATSHPDAESLTKLRKHLAGAGLSADQRAVVAVAARKVSASLYAQLRSGFDLKDVPGTPLSDLIASTGGRGLIDRTERRADAAIALLQLAGFKDDQVQKLHQEALEVPTDPRKWHALEHRLRQVWMVDVQRVLMDQIRSGQEVLTVERILRAAPAGLEGFDKFDTLPGFGKLFWQEEDKRQGWLRERFRDYAKLRENSPPAAKFFRGLVDRSNGSILQGER